MAAATDTQLGEIILDGDLNGDGGPQIGTNPQLTHIGGLTPGQYDVADITVDSKGRITAIADASSASISALVPDASTTVKGVVKIGANLYIQDTATAGFWTVDCGFTAGGDATGLANQPCATYTFDIEIDGDATIQPISVAGEDVQTVTTLLAEINTDLTGATAALSGGDIVITSGTTGKFSRVEITNDSLFACLNTFVSIGSETPGVGACELYAKDATTGVAGVVQIGTGIDVTAGVISVDCGTLPIATTTTLGAVIVPAAGHIDVDVSGNISVPYATEGSPGVIQVGPGLDVTAGVLSVDVGEIDDATYTSKGVVQIGTNINVITGEISVPEATGSTKGVMQSGTGLSLTSGVLDLDIASVGALGGIKVGSGLSIDGGGVLSVDTIADATYASKGIVQIQSGTGLDVTTGVLSGLNATTSTKGVIQVGTGLAVDGAGVLSGAIATDSSLGVIQVGTGLTIDGAGVLAATAVPDATHTSKGIVQIETAGNGLTVAAGVLSLDDAAVGTFGGVSIGSGGNIDVTAGEISVPEATTVVKGVMEVPGGDGLAVTTGTLTFTYTAATTTALGGVKIPAASVISNTAGSIDVQDATGAQKGVVQVGSNLTVSAGEINVDKAVAGTTFGVVRSADTDHLTITAGEIDVGVNIPALDTANTFTKAQTVAKSTLTYGATINTDASLSNVFEVTLTGNATLANPTNLVSGGTYLWVVKQDGTGGRTLAYGTSFAFPDGITPVLSTAINAVDVISAVYDGTNLLAVFNGGFA